MIRSKPSTDEYREAWERVFGSVWAVGMRATWHYPKGSASPYSWRCACDRHGTVESVRTLTNGRMHVDRLALDDGSIVDPTVSPEELTAISAPCPWSRG